MTDTEIALTERERAIVLETLRPFATSFEQVGVFGSRVMGTNTAASDIDLVVYGDISPMLIDRLRTRFDDSNLAVRVDVVHYEQVRGTPIGRHIDAVAQYLFKSSSLLAPASAFEAGTE